GLEPLLQLGDRGHLLRIRHGPPFGPGSSGSHAARQVPACVPPAKGPSRRTPRRGAPGRGHRPVRTPGADQLGRLRGPPALAGPSVAARWAHGNSRRSWAWLKSSGTASPGQIALRLSPLSQRRHSSVAEGPTAMKVLLPDEQVEAVVLAEILEVLG